MLLTSTEATYANSREPARIAVETGADLTVPVVEATPVGTSIAGTDTESALAAASSPRSSSSPGWRRSGGVGSAGTRSRVRTSPTSRSSSPTWSPSYADGHRAVDGVSWRAEKGQVVGLLGPNGAGKTTTMRMVMGLIAPDSGTVHVLATPVSAGSDVLERVGALIEAGLPPAPDRPPEPRGLLGRDRPATGRGAHRRDARGGRARRSRRPAGALLQPWHAAARHRPGHARAPELLVLDEPTNGSTRRRSRRCARFCAATPRPVAPSSSRATCSPRSR